MLYNVILSLFFTIFIEVMVSILCGINKKHDIFAIILINIITNPITEIINLLIENTYFHYPVILGIEVIITVIEYQYYKRNLEVKDINFMYLSVMNNLCSWIIGILFNLKL